MSRISQNEELLLLVNISFCDNMEIDNVVNCVH